MNCSTSSGFASEFSQSPEDSIRYCFTDENICGEGASCFVYRSRLNGLRVAVKRLKEECRTNPCYVASYKKEFQIGQQLKHDGLPVYRELYVDVNEAYIVMDYIDGVSLGDFLDTASGQQYFSTYENANRFFRQFLDVVGYLHRSGVIHCDIKPTNVMLRHSDRGVMLLDLDKAYSDSLDRTHGGTPSMSDPLSNGKTPTIAKDFAAIGNLIDYISEQVPAFPNRQFSKLQRECNNPKANDESIVQSLESKSHVGAWIASIGTLCLISVGVYYYGNQTTSTEEVRSEESLPIVIPDTVRIIEERQPPTIEAPVTSPSKQPTITIDFDNRMSAFIQEANGVLTSLRNGELTDKEIRDKMFEIVESYTSKYQDILNTCKSENPVIPGIDVEMTVAKVSECSQATKLLQQFTQAASDTLTNRKAPVE